MNQKCKKCQKIYKNGTDGYCRKCIEQEQKGALSDWEDINKNNC